MLTQNVGIDVNKDRRVSDACFGLKPQWIERKSPKILTGDAKCVFEYFRLYPRCEAKPPSHKWIFKTHKHNMHRPYKLIMHRSETCTLWYVSLILVVCISCIQQSCGKRIIKRQKELLIYVHISWVDTVFRWDG